MKLFILVLLVASAFAAPGQYGEPGTEKKPDIKDDYNENQEQFQKEFNLLENDEEKEAEKDNLKKAEEQINGQNKKFEDGDSDWYEKEYEFSDLPKKDFEHEKEGAKAEDDSQGLDRIGSRIAGTFDPPESQKFDAESQAYLNRIYERETTALPTSYDARDLNYITSPKNQQQCGSCAAFGATGLHEACMAKAGANVDTLDLSEQHIIDCGYDGDSMMGCNGAYVHSYQEYFRVQGGMGISEADYPYLNTEPKLECPHSQYSTVDSGAMVSTIAWDYECTEAKMMALIVEHGAVSGALYASDAAFSNYAGGVLTECSSTSINHAILIVGYGTEDDVNYWLVKNSWGTYWGDSGYIKIKRGENTCGLEQRCIVAGCDSTNGSSGYLVTTTTTTTPAPGSITTCDVTSMFGYITGTYNIRVRMNGVLYESSVSCENGICTPTTTVTNACTYICGSTGTTCP